MFEEQFAKNTNWKAEKLEFKILLLPDSRFTLLLTASSRFAPLKSREKKFQGSEKTGRASEDKRKLSWVLGLQGSMRLWMRQEIEARKMNIWALKETWPLKKSD